MSDFAAGKRVKNARTLMVVPTGGRTGGDRTPGQEPALREHAAAIRAEFAA